MQDAGFDLRKWVTNDPELRNYIASTELSEGNAPVKGDDLRKYRAKPGRRAN